MRQISADFFAAQQAGTQPLILVILTSKMTRRIYGIRYASDTEQGSGKGELKLYNGDWKYGDGTIFGTLGTIADSGARVIGFGGIRETLTPEKGNLLASLTQTEIGSYTITLDNADGKFSDILKDESFLNNDLELIFGFRGLPFSEFKSLFTGSVEEETLSLSKLRLVAAGTLAFKTAMANTSLFLPSYALASTTGNIGAELTTAFETIASVFYLSASWVCTINFSSSIKDVAFSRELFKLRDENYSFTRLEIGIDRQNRIYVTVATDIVNGVFVTFPCLLSVSDDPTVHYQLTIDWRNDSQFLFATLNGTRRTIDTSGAPNGFDRADNFATNSIVIGQYLGGSINSIQWDSSWYVINNTGTALPTEFVDVLGGLNVPLADGVWQLW